MVLVSAGLGASGSERRQVGFRRRTGAQLAGEMAGGYLPGASVRHQRRLDFGAHPGSACDRTARVKAAAARRIDRGGNLALERDRLAVGLAARVWYRDRAEQGTGVGVLRTVV